MTTARVELNNVYQNISQGDLQLRVHISSGTARIVSANTQPANGATGFFTIQNGDPQYYDWTVDPNTILWARASSDTVNNFITVARVTPNSETVAGGGGGGLTNTELRATPVPVLPAMGSGGFLTANTSAANGASFTAFASQVCKQLTISCDQDLSVQQGGAGAAFFVPQNTMFTMFGISNANVIAVKRKDDANTATVVSARWEA